MINRRSGSAPASLRGILLIDKPTGLTSHDVVVKVRRVLVCEKWGTREPSIHWLQDSWYSVWAESPGLPAT